MEVGAVYDKRKLHGKRYFGQLLERVEDVPESVKDLLNLESVSENYLLTQPMAIKNPTISGRVPISSGYLVILGMVHDFQCSSY
jgi:hypothetical protein